MNRKVSALLVVSLLIFSIDLPSKERRGAELVVRERGAELVVTKNDGQTLKGELIAVKENSVLLLRAEGTDVSVDIKDIDIIKIEKKSKVLKAAGIGFLVGAGTGAILGAVGADMPDERGLGAIIGAGVVGALGLLVGTIFGAAASPYKEIKIKGKSDTETKRILEKLRRQARLPNAE